MEDQSYHQERRNGVRLEASCPCTYTRFDDRGMPYDQRPSRSVDLSLEGVKIRSSFPVELGEVLKITMALGSSLVTFRGEVVHVTHAEGQAFDFGLSIREIAKMDRITLTRFIYYFKPSKPTG